MVCSSVSKAELRAGGHLFSRKNARLFKRPPISALDTSPPRGRHREVTIFTSRATLEWGRLDVPLWAIEKDWQGSPVVPGPALSLVADPSRLWWIASHRAPAELHPRARPGVFQTNLWEYDLAELFLTHAASGRYFEFNLAPNGAWWSCEFTAPRVRAESVEIEMPEVATFAEMAPDGSWVAAMALPLDLLRARLDFGPETRANVTMILGSPEQRFLSVAKLPGETPDFHQPEGFSRLRFVPLRED